MNEIDELEEDIKHLKKAYNTILEAMDYLNEVEGIMEEYQQLETLADTIDNKRIDKEYELEQLEDEAYMQENEEQWKAEQKEQLREFWDSRLYRTNLYETYFKNGKDE